MISDMWHDELSMNENSDKTISKNKKESRSTVRFLDSEHVEKICNASDMLKIKNVKLVNVLQQMTE